MKKQKKQGVEACKKRNYSYQCFSWVSLDINYFDSVFIVFRDLSSSRNELLCGYNIMAAKHSLRIKMWKTIAMNEQMNTAWKNGKCYSAVMQR